VLGNDQLEARVEIRSFGQTITPIEEFREDKIDPAPLVAGRVLAPPIE
jgi:hypothetical protein